MEFILFQAIIIAIFFFMDKKLSIPIRVHFVMAVAFHVIYLLLENTSGYYEFNDGITLIHYIALAFFFMALGSVSMIIVKWFISFYNFFDSRRL